MPQVIRPPGQLSYSIQVTGGRPASVRDAYHALLRMPWSAALGVIVVSYLLLNALFAAAFTASGGIANAQRGSFVDAFFFSVQTMGTIGYGSMYPVSRLANSLVVVESIVGLITTALATGLVFVRFSLTKGRIVFSRKLTIGPVDGMPTLMVRLGNDRKNQIYDAQMKLSLMLTRRSKEGVRWYQMQELSLVRSNASALARSWNLLHRIDGSSPLFGHTPESLAEAEAELTVSVSGVDDTSLQFVHGRWTYESPAIEWGARLADVLSELPDGNMLLDLRYFDRIIPTEPTAEFPYPRSASAGAR